jgi:hypothetical protein
MLTIILRLLILPWSLRTPSDPFVDVNGSRRGSNPAAVSFYRWVTRRKWLRLNDLGQTRPAEISRKPKCHNGLRSILSKNLNLRHGHEA